VTDICYGFPDLEQRIRIEIWAGGRRLRTWERCSTVSKAVAWARKSLADLARGDGTARVIRVVGDQTLIVMGAN